MKTFSNDPYDDCEMLGVVEDDSRPILEILKTPEGEVVLAQMLDGGSGYRDVIQLKAEDLLGVFNLCLPELLNCMEDTDSDG